MSSSWPPMTTRSCYVNWSPHAVTLWTQSTSLANPCRSLTKWHQTSSSSCDRLLTGVLPPISGAIFAVVTTYNMGSDSQAHQQGGRAGSPLLVPEACGLRILRPPSCLALITPQPVPSAAGILLGIVSRRLFVVPLEKYTENICSF